MKHKLLLFALALLIVLWPGRCSARGVTAPTFEDLHVCHASGGDAMLFTCHFHSGDTVSEVVHFVNRSYHDNGQAFLDLNPQITNPNKIRAGGRFLIRVTSVCNGMMLTGYRLHRSRARKAIAVARAFAPAQLDGVRNAEATVAGPSPLSLNDGSATGLAQAVFASGNYQVVYVAPAAETSTATATAPTAAPATTVAKTETPAAEQPARPHKKLTSYTLVADKDLKGPLQTQLLLFDSIDEQQAGLPSRRINLKDSSTRLIHGQNVVFVRLKELPKQPFFVLVGGINHPVDGDQLLPHYGHTPGSHVVLTMVKQSAVTYGLSTLSVGPVFAAIPTTIPLGRELISSTRASHRQKKASALQANIDDKRLEVYRAQKQLDQSKQRLIAASKEAE